MVRLSAHGAVAEQNGGWCRRILIDKRDIDQLIEKSKKSLYQVPAHERSTARRNYYEGNCNEEIKSACTKNTYDRLGLQALGQAAVAGKTFQTEILDADIANNSKEGLGYPAR